MPAAEDILAELEGKSVALSGDPGGGKGTTGKRLLERMERYGVDWTMKGVGDHFREIYRSVPDRVKEHARLLGYGFPEKFGDWWAQLSMEDQHAINAEFLEQVRDGDVNIADSRYVHIYNEENGCDTLRVYITAPLHVRAERLAQDRELLEERYPYLLDASFDERVEQLADDLQRRQENEVQIGKELWNDEWEKQHGTTYDHRDSVHYHRVIDSSKHGKEEVVDIILDELGVTEDMCSVLEEAATL